MKLKLLWKSIKKIQLILWINLKQGKCFTEVYIFEIILNWIYTWHKIRVWFEH